MAVTAGGTPYVESSDLVANYPGASLALANRVDQVMQAPTQNAITSTTYTAALLDAGKTVTLSNAAAVTLTIPAQATVAWAANTQLNFLNIGVGTVTITPAATVTINGTPLTLATSKGGSLVRTASNTWTFIPFSAGEGAANFTNTATGTYTTGGIDYKYITFTSSGSLVIDRAGSADVLLISAGGGGAAAVAGAGGRMIIGEASLPVGTLTVTVGAINSIAQVGGFSKLGTIVTGLSPAFYGGNNPEATTDDNNATTGYWRGRTSSITGTALEYGKEGRSGAPTANRGDGGVTGGGNNGSAGVVIVRVAI